MVFYLGFSDLNPEEDTSGIPALSLTVSASTLTLSGTDAVHAQVDMMFGRLLELNLDGQPLSLSNLCPSASFLVNLEWSSVSFLFFSFFFFFFFLFRAEPEACGSPQVRGQIGTAAASLHHHHSNAGSKPCSQPTPQLTTMPYP